MKISDKVDLTLLRSTFEENETPLSVKKSIQLKQTDIPSINETKANPKSNKTSSIAPFNEEPKNFNEDELKGVVKELNKLLSSLNRALKVEIDRDLKIPVFKIIDLETKEVVRQIPLEEILKFKKALTAFLEKYGALSGKEAIPKVNQGEVPDIKGLFLKKEV
jgi:flagellar protein FlaG